MKKPTQASTNPYPNSDSDKRYYTYDYYLRRTYGEKCAKITLDAGFTCPNIDGTRGRGGCIYCSSRGSGDFAETADVPIAEQYARQVEKMRQKWDVKKFLPYLQAHTNTYAPVDVLRPLYEEILALPGAVGFHIATRADCINEENAALLASVADRTDLTVELGLQSVSDTTARLINRGHTFAEFLAGYRTLRQASPRIRIAVHLINGLPGEGREEMLENVRVLGALHPDEVKIHLLHVLRGTVLGAMYERGEYTPLAREDYIATVAAQLELLPPDTVIGRLTGDGAEGDLLAPEWSKKKLTVLNDIDKILVQTDSFQGKMYNLHKSE